MKHLIKISTYGALSLLMALPVFAEMVSASNIEMGGSARVRHEASNNKDFLDSSSDSRSFTASRFRVHFLAKPTDKVQVYFEPQYTKVWGLRDSGNNSTSGALNDTELDIHQAYTTYKAFGSGEFTLGRKEIAYGDHMLIGSVGWSNVARSFDFAKYRHNFDNAWVDVFSAKLNETNSGTASPGDLDLNGVYLNYKGIPTVNDFDLYYLLINDATTSPSSEVTAAGFRAKSKIGAFDYRFEYTSETVAKESENNMDLELGYTLGGTMKPRFSFEYFKASKNYNQLFPTAHKWLGYADLFSRKNIGGFRVGASADICSSTSLQLDYHTFTRTDTDVHAYNFGGAAYGTTASTSDAIATEIDFTVKRKLDEKTSLLLVYSTVTAGQYLKDQGAKDAANFIAFQFATKF